MNELENNNFRYMDSPQSRFMPRNKSEQDYLRRMQVRQAFWYDRQRKKSEDRLKDKVTNRGLSMILENL
jgi:hypothetical protein